MKTFLTSFLATAGMLSMVPPTTACTAALAPGQSATAREARPVVEWAPFRLVAGVDESALLRASAALQRDFLASQPGFIRRELLSAGDGRWVDLVLWTDQASADAAVKRAGSSQACHAYFSLMADADHAAPGAGVSHFTQVAVYTGR